MDGSTEMTSNKRQRAHHGFTLFELMVALLIVGLLASLGYASYQSYSIKAKRQDAMIGLHTLANELARHYHQSRPPSYQRAVQRIKNNNQDIFTSPQGYYELKVHSADEVAFELVAIAKPPLSQWDADCLRWTLNHMGIKKSFNSLGEVSDSCWKFL